MGQIGKFTRGGTVMLLVAVVLATTATAAFAVAPSNDNFSAATIISGSSGSTAGSNVDATLETDEGCFFYSSSSCGGASIWYRWTAPATGDLTLTTAASDFNTELAALTGPSLTSLTHQADNDNVSDIDVTSAVTLPVTSSATYRIVVGGFDSGSGPAMGNVTLNWNLVAAPANDPFAGSTLISGATGSIAGTTVAATHENSEPCLFYTAYSCGVASVWYRWVAPSTTTVVFDTLTSSHNTLLAVASGGSLGTLSHEADNDDFAGGIASRVSVAVTGGVTYRIVVDGYDDGLDPSVGTFTLHWATAPVNDHFENASTILGTSGSASGDNTVASGEPSEPNHAGIVGGVSVWYAWTAPNTGGFSFDTTGSAYDTLLAVYTGSTVDALTSIVAANDGGGGATSKVTFTAINGTTYKIAVDGFGGAIGAYQLHWAQIPPTNDGFSAAQAITGASGSATGSNVAGSKETSEPSHAGNAGGTSVWYSWTAPGTGSETITTASSSFNTLLAVYTGSPVSALTLVASNDDASDGTSRLTFDATSGVTYRIAVDGKDAATGSIALAWAPTPVDATAPTVTITAPGSITGSITATFSEPVRPVDATNLVLRVSTTSTNLAGARTCRSQSSTIVSCTTGEVKTVTLLMNAALIPGQRYTVIANPGAIQSLQDLAGNPLTTSSKSFRASLSEQQTSKAATTQWRKVSTSSAYGGSYRVEHLAGAAATYAFTGTSVTWYTVKGKSFGKAQVLIDGVAKATINNYASTTAHHVARTVSGLANAAHTLTIKVLGQKGSTSGTDTAVAIDAIKVGSASIIATPAIKTSWRSVSTSSASGGSYVVANLSGATMTFTFRGTAIGWTTVTGKAMGKATVRIDGVSKGTFDNYSSSTLYGKKRSFSGLSDAVHTITITVTGTKRSAATGTNIAVDRFTIV